MSAGRWLSWLMFCVGAGIVLGLLGLPGNVEGADRTQGPRNGGLRADAALASLTEPGLVRAPAASFTTRGEVRLGRADRVRSARPRIAIVIDDLGLSQSAFDRVNALPPPLTLGFLPYGHDAQAMLDQTRPGHETMLHLPTEPRIRVDDAGPDMLRIGTEASIQAAIEANFAKLSGFNGVNNHTGSRFTEDAAAMSVLLSDLDRRGLYFLDSVTTPKPVAARLAGRQGWRVVERDVFLDDDYEGGEDAVRAQLAELERIALAEGEAIAIGHPYKATVRVLGPWLVTAQARGFELVPVSALTEQPSRETLAGLR